MSTATINNTPSNTTRWERAVPVYGFPVVNRFFLVLCGMTLLAFVLTAYRELAGLGPVSGMNDAYGWGIWKTFNVTVLTALGSGAFAVGIAAWVFRRKKLHALMRMALLTSFLAYACGLLLLGIDAGRPADVLLVGIKAGSYEVGCSLSESVRASLDQAIAEVLCELDRLDVGYVSRKHPVELHLWWAREEKMEAPSLAT
ncbi:MAG: hypothetical protein WB711_04380 [Terriglobales bacterium]